MLECEDKMLESYEQYKYCTKLQSECTAQDESSFRQQCLLNIIEARNLPVKMLRPYVSIQLLKSENDASPKEIGATQAQPKDNPVFNERFQFNV